MKLLQIGDRVINIEPMTGAKIESLKGTTRLTLTFNPGNTQIFFDTEADIVWGFILAHAYNAPALEPKK